MLKKSKGELIFLGIILLYTVIYYLTDISPLQSETESKSYVLLIMLVLIALIVTQFITILSSSKFLQLIQINAKDILYIVKTQLFYLIICTVAYLVLIPVVGFFVTTFIYIDVVLWSLRIRKKLILLIVPFVYIAIMFYAFDFLLNVRFPRGLLF